MATHVEDEWAAAERAWAEMETELDAQQPQPQAAASPASAGADADASASSAAGASSAAAGTAVGGASKGQKRSATKTKTKAKPPKKPKRAAQGSAAAAAAAADGDGGAVVSQRRLKQYAGSGKTGPIPITVGLTGARAGDILNGWCDDTANVVLRIDTGTIAAPAVIRRSVEHEVGREKVIASVAKHFGIATAAAEMRYNDCPTSEQPNHAPLGQGCHHHVGAVDGDKDGCGCEPAARFTILNQGVWQQFADEHGNGP